MRHLVTACCVALAIGETFANGPEFTFAECSDTNKHVSVQRHKDHYLVHYHLRIEGCRGREVFSRIRVQYPDGTGDNTTISDTVTIKADAENEIWSFYFRVPRLESDALQKQTVYQVEVGVREPSEVEEFAVYNSVGWKIERDGQGREQVSRTDGIPIRIRVGHVEGGRIVIRYGHGAPVPVSDDVTCAVVLQGLEADSIPGERSVKKIN